MHIVAIGWMFVVILMSIVEASSPQGSILGALITFILYGVGPVAIVMYILGTPMRRRARRRAEAAATADSPPYGIDASAEAPADSRKD